MRNPFPDVQRGPPRNALLQAAPPCHQPGPAAVDEAIREPSLDHEPFIERSRQALAKSPAAPNSPGGIGALKHPVSPTARPTVDSQLATAEPPRISKAQWIVYFVAELAAIAPRLSDRKAFGIASQLSSMARGVAPEHAAASMAAGLSAQLLH